MERAACDARLRLASLWLSQTARVLADNVLRMVVVLTVAQLGDMQQKAAWYQVTQLFILPFLVLAPLNGALSNSWPKRPILAASAAWCLAAAGVMAWLLEERAGPWTICAALGVAMAGTAVFSTVRYAILPAAAEDTRIPLPRINGWIETGGATGIVLGLLIGVQLQGSPEALAVILGLNVLVLATALPVGFPSDVCRREPVGAAVAGFFRDARRIFDDPEARASLLSLAVFFSLISASVGALLAYTDALADREMLRWSMLLIGIGVAVGSAVASVQGHPQRTLGLVPFGATGILLALGWALWSHDLVGPSLALGFMSGLVNAPLRATVQRLLPADARGNGMAVSYFVNYLFTSVLVAALYFLTQEKLLSPVAQLWTLAGMATLAAAAAWVVLRRDSFEQCLEILFLPIYRIYGCGPGLIHAPTRGPLLVIANHTAWFDPLWVGKVYPRQLIPMMTSDFYDRPGVYWIFRYVFTAIRVQAAAFRRTAPEIQEAIRELDRGNAVSLWPEGWLRRRPEPSLRMFGRGVWQILSQRPQTPVVVCWVEGGYGTYASYFKGKPTKNKPFDFWRRIDVAVTDPQLVPKDILADQRATRLYLMRECLKARGLLGLEVPPLPEVDVGKEEEEGEPGA